MAYSDSIAHRIRGFLNEQGILFFEKEMMGGLVFMVNDKMCIGVIKDEMMCRIDKTLHNELVEKNGCRTMDFTKKPMMGYVLVEEAAMQTYQEFSAWVQLCLEFNPRANASKKRSTKKPKN